MRTKKMEFVHKFLHENSDKSQLEKMRLARQWIQDRIGSKNTENDLKQFNMMAEIHTFMHETKGMDMR